MKKIPERKPTRLKNYDYGTNGAYFITICTKDRKEILSRLDTVGEGFALPQLTIYGEITDRVIHEISVKYPDVSVDHYMIMPDHIHMVLFIHKENGRADPSPTVTAVVSWMKYRITKEILQTNGGRSRKVFQRSFYDHIIRDRDDYNAIVKYIYDNPGAWLYKAEKP